MANEKKLREAAIKFRKENQRQHSLYSILLSRMAKFITKSGAPEVTVGVEYDGYYEFAND
jgi:hypothetical protein